MDACVTSTTGKEIDPTGVAVAAHYNKHPSGVETIEITRHMCNNLGNAMKYIWRLEDKEGPLKNAKKALWYINDELNYFQPLAILPEPEALVIINPLMRDVLSFTNDKGQREAMRYIYLANLTRDRYYFLQAHIYVSRLIAIHG
jgi:hypothetical protein